MVRLVLDRELNFCLVEGIRIVTAAFAPQPTARPEDP